MVAKIDTARVFLWGELAGAVSWLDESGYAVFEYAPEFLDGNRDIAPIHMSLAAARRGERLFSFPTLNKDSFLGLPGLLADALPDRFGNHIIDAWLARQGRAADEFSPVERLCYTGKRGMGALEFAPAYIDGMNKSIPVEIAELARLAQTITTQRDFHVSLANDERSNADAIKDILRVGTSAGGARPKAVIAMSAHGEVRSGQAPAPNGYDYWIIKFDGVDDLELGEPRGYGRIEYAYALMARAAGIEMSECRLLEENGRAHFITKRFDRINGEKLHLQSLCGIAHYDYNMAGAYSYEQAFSVMRQLRLSKAEAIQLYRRMLFNVIARNQDDHTKNISFLMTRDGKWRLAPAYDMIYSHNPKGQWTNQHQMTVNAKRDGFALADLLAVAQAIGAPRAREMIDETIDVVSRWKEFALRAGIRDDVTAEIARNHRLGF